MPKKAKKVQKSTSIRGLEEEFVPHTDFAGLTKTLFSKEVSANIETLYNTVKASPETMACITAIDEDIMADGWRFIGGPTKSKAAREFQIKSKFYKVLANAILDLLITGNAYILKLSVDEDKVKSVMEVMTKQLAKTFNVKMKKKTDYSFLQQDLKKPRDLQLLKSSTIKINFDETGEVSSYEQEVQGKKKVFKEGDVIHLSMLNIGGQPYGFTPLETLLSDIATLIFAKEFAGKYFENDGMPGWLMNLPEDSPDSRNYELLKKEIKKMKKERNKQRILLTTGKINAEQINKFNKDLEFAKLIQHFTQIILMAFGVPAHRVNLTIDVKGTASELGKVESGYYKKISFMQKIIEDTFNAELWNNWDVEMRFFHSYKIDEMREAQVAQIAAQVGFMTIEEIRERMGMEPALPKGTMGNKTGDENNIDFGRDKKDEKGQENPTDTSTDNKLKQKSVGAFEVTWTNFVILVENKMGTEGFDKAKLFYVETMKDFIIYFADENWKYKTVVPKESIDVEKFKVERLRNAIQISNIMGI